MQTWPKVRKWWMSVNIVSEEVYKAVDAQWRASDSYLTLHGPHFICSNAVWSVIVFLCASLANNRFFRRPFISGNIKATVIWKAGFFNFWPTLCQSRFILEVEQINYINLSDSFSVVVRNYFLIFVVFHHVSSHSLISSTWGSILLQYSDHVF